ncbi:hypothetical protein K3H78_RS19715 [Escherichia coli]|uniref:hypothetical protein n=1 Tax=Escherichia coli TaxID=562 RepID=UPI0015D4B86F|nr:hypothetical protein [Escherichia coli]EHW6857911.1 hypothetical protein [Escherichia coli]EJS8935383.1 hypothetical protein [Escherichia coli]EJZ7717225.1 hypothetical protein [Salmonella enterica]
MRGAAPAALPARLSGQKVVYGCMQGTGVIFRDTVTVSGCLLLRPLRLPAAWRHPVVRPDSDRQLLAHPPVSAEPAGAVSGCRYGPMRENPACSDRSGRAAPVAPRPALPAHLTVCEETAPDGAAVFPPAATPAACFPLWTFRGADVTPSRSICPG